MSLEDWKSAYMQLPEPERRDFARWVLAQELGGTSAERTAEIIPPAVQAAVRATIPGGAKAAAPKSDWTTVFDTAWFKPVAACLISLLLLGGIGWQVWSWKQNQAETRAAETDAERMAREAATPRSPLNLEFLRANIGNEITVRGRPLDSDVGYLYFHRDRKQALRLNLFAGNVVLIQSTELEEMVKSGQEIAATGVIELTEDGWLEMRIIRANQLRTFER